MTRRALLVSGSIGMGHDMVAGACESSLRARSWSTQMVDAMRLLGRGGSGGEAVFRAMMAVPGLYDAFHFAALRTGGPITAALDAAARRRILPRLRTYFEADPVDLTISLYPTGASAVSELASEYSGLRHMVFCTDVTPHRLWVHPNVSLYLVTSAAAERAIRRFHAEARTVIVPTPLRPAFYAPTTQASARLELGVPADERCVLLMSGAWGIGPLAEAALALGDAGLHVLAVAGNNGTLERKLRSAARRQPLVHPFGFTDRIAGLMAASDLVITSSGDTCAEARTVGRPLLLLDVVQGHGRDNLQHELELGEAGVTSGRAADVVRNAVAELDRAKPPPAGPTRSPADWEASFTSALSMIGL
jgi:processive 1,2-diacylglycerol beta-glucosyltransferase